MFPNTLPLLLIQQYSVIKTKEENRVYPDEVTAEFMNQVHQGES